MTDIEMVELAAKAAGIKYDPESAKPNPVSGVWFGLWLVFDREPNEYDRRRWNPLADDGDALRLAVSLQIGIDWHRQACVDKLACPRWYTAANQYGDVNAATRLAIVRAAAQIAREAS